MSLPGPVSHPFRILSILGEHTPRPRANYSGFGWSEMDGTHGVFAADAASAHRRPAAQPALPALPALPSLQNTPA
eukprot:2033239-Prymnesium_polylepis.1